MLFSGDGDERSWREMEWEKEVGGGMGLMVGRL